MKLSVNTNIFFFLKPNALIVWDYKNHTQFELSLEYFKKIVEINSGSENISLDQDPILVDLIENNLIIKGISSNDNWQYDILSKIFHMGTSDIIQTHEMGSAYGFANDYIKYCNTLQERASLPTVCKFLNRVILTRDYVEFKFSNLKQCLYKRKTVRIFKSQEISKELLSTLLYYSFGYIHDVDKSSDNIFDIARRKATPSGGNLHPTEVYIITNNITSLENSLYHYNAENHALDCIQQNITLEWLPQALLGQHFSVSANIHVFLTFKFNVGAWKYPHSRGYRAALLDVGHLSQTFQLVSTALGLNTWITGAFEDTKINTVLNIDGENESTLFYLSAGMSDGQSIPLEFSQIAQELAVV